MSYGVSSIYRQRSGSNRMEHKYRKGAIHGPTVITPKQSKPVPTSTTTRQQTLRAAWAKHFPHLMLSDKNYHRLSLIPYREALIDIALSKTAASAAFGTNQRYTERDAINYTAAIARCLAGKSPLPKRPYRGSIK